MSNRLISAIEKFSDLVSKRVMKSFPTSEDWVRYAFYEILSEKFKIGALEFSFEVPFSSSLLPSVCVSSDCKLDALISFGTISYAFEVKFLRVSGCVANSAFPANTGLLINDINRLSHINSERIQKYMLYVTDDRFHSYMARPRNNLDKLYQLVPSNSPMKLDMDYIANHCDTFIRNAKKSVVDDIDCDVQAIFTKDINSGYHIRVLNVL